ncbi:hypothetical protein NFI96_019893 [Prochilodus magdalenae]|nr:hypothetical protein NFI96_019893 [Prochilodus magdalenae]
MAKAKKLADFEHGRIVELHKQGLSQRAIAAEVGRNGICEGEASKKKKGLQRPCLLQRHKTARLDFAWEHQTWDTAGGRKFYSLMRIFFTLMVLMASSVIGMTRKSHLRCFLHCTVSGGTIMIWGAFSFSGTTELQVVQGRQAAAGFVEMLQRASLMTEGPRLCGSDWVFQLDNAAVHNA